MSPSARSASSATSSYERRVKRHQDRTKASATTSLSASTSSVSSLPSPSSRENADYDSPRTSSSATSPATTRSERDRSSRSHKPSSSSKTSRTIKSSVPNPGNGDRPTTTTTTAYAAAKTTLAPDISQQRKQSQLVGRDSTSASTGASSGSSSYPDHLKMRIDSTNHSAQTIRSHPTLESQSISTKRSGNSSTKAASSELRVQRLLKEREERLAKASIGAFSGGTSDNDNNKSKHYKLTSHLQSSTSPSPPRASGAASLPAQHYRTRQDMIEGGRQQRRGVVPAPNLESIPDRPPLPTATTAATTANLNLDSIPDRPPPPPQSFSSMTTMTTASTRPSPRELLASARAARQQQQQQISINKSTTPVDETKRTLNSSVAGCSTLRTSRQRQHQTVDVSADTTESSAGSLDHAAMNSRMATTAVVGNSKVDKYLASRASATSTTSTGSAVRAVSSFEQSEGDDSSSATEEESESESAADDSYDYDDSYGSSDDDDSALSEEEEEWSVRVCVVSAVDFPASVVPNLPLSPLLKVGLVPLPVDSENPQEETSSSKNKDADIEAKRIVAAQIEKDGLSSIPRSRIRCTSSKVLSRRDNGSVEFHEEMRWDRVRDPYQMALALELTSRAVMAPANMKESPPAQTAEPLSLKPSNHRPGDEDGSGRGGAIGGLFRKKNGKNTEMETANAAAAVAKLLVEEGNAQGEMGSKPSPTKSSKQSELRVKLRRRKKRKRARMTEDLRLGSQVIPLSCLQLEKAMQIGQSTRIEQWFELESAADTATAVTKHHKSLTSGTSKRNPSILLEISFAAPEVLDDSEDDLDEADDVDAELRASFSKRASIKIRNQLKQEVAATEKKIEEPALVPAILDYVCVVGARDIGDQKADDGARGWVNTTPECAILERFPPNDEFHFQNGRQTVLAEKIEWFCFPEGVKLWRGSTPPNAEEMNLKRFSASTPPSISTTTALFDACLGCTTSFSWFVIASNSEEYGSETTKTYGAVIRFYVPAPVGIDPTQDDFAQTLMPEALRDHSDISERKRLWVPLAFCITSTLPIVGIMEAMLLRMCEELASRGTESIDGLSSVIREDLTHMIVNFQRPIAGVVSCSVPFLTGERFHISIPPRRGLPRLPHGNAIASVCRLLGADGLLFLLAALLTECKILLHSDDVANVSLVAEVMTALLYPFQWSLPYVPVLPVGMMEFIEAPLSYLLGIPSSNLKYIDPHALEDVVVVDLDTDYSSNEVFEGRKTKTKSKQPIPLPASVASNISKAVYQLLRAEEEVEDFGNMRLGNTRTFPRMEMESLAEREFRLAVAVEVCGLVKGLQECLVYASSSQPVFNSDKFLQTAPVMFEDQRGTSSHGETTQRVISPRSRRFMSTFVTCQHFHQFLEMLDGEHLYVFREVMNLLKARGGRRNNSLAGMLQSLDNEPSMAVLLAKKLQRFEDKIPTYRVIRPNETGEEKRQDCFPDSPHGVSRFPIDLLQPIVIEEDSNGVVLEASGTTEGVKQVSVQYLVELEKNPWRYHGVLCNGKESEPDKKLVKMEKIKLRDAIGDRRYRAWQIAQVQDRYDGDDLASVFSDESRGRGSNAVLDLDALINSAAEDISPSPSSENGEKTDEEMQQQRLADARGRDILRRCLERARVSGEPIQEVQADKESDLVSAAELALQNRAARRFLVSILSKRSQLDESTKKEPKSKRRQATSTAGSKLGKDSFEVLVRLGCAMLDACVEHHEYDLAIALLKYTAGLFMGSPDGEDSVVYLTGRIGLHPIYAVLGLWDLVKRSHFQARLEAHKTDGAELDEIDREAEEYEAAVATLYEMAGYGIPAEELARFASRVSEQNRWFKNERGQALLMLSRRLCVRRENTEIAGSHFNKQKSDIELMRSAMTIMRERRNYQDHFDETDHHWVETSWCHPAAKSSRRLNASEHRTTTRRPGTQNLLNMLEDQILPQTGRKSSRMKRAAVTTMAYLGSSVVVTGGLDGGVFLARQVPSESPDGDDGIDVSGLHLDWGSSGSRYTAGSSATAMDGEYGVGAVACLAATRGTHHSYETIGANAKAAKDTSGPVDDDDLLRAMDGCRVVAGTTCGDLRVWSAKDVLSAVFYAKGNDSISPSSYSSPPHRKGTDFAAGSSLTRLKFSLRGRALSGHRGGVSCVDVPSNVYRPDSIVSGGADGLIKLWSLRAPSGSGRTEIETTSRFLASPDSSHTRAARNGDALSILSGHGGRILCVKTAWHGDRLLSGGADRIVRIWDIAGSGGRCLNSLSGHFGWVTAVRYWGPNTIISASTDRSIALWDARVRNTPLFTLRHHYAPVSDLLVGTRTDPIMMSSAMDGTVAAWDFRRLSSSPSSTTSGSGNPPPHPQGCSDKRNSKRCKVVRDPVAQLYMRDFSRQRHIYGPVLLSKATRNDQYKTIYCLGSDAVLREWDIQTGDVISEHVTGHCDTISSFCSLEKDCPLDTQLEGSRRERATGTITASWDGTIRFRRLCSKKSSI